MLRESDIVSCCPELLYDGGGYYDTHPFDVLVNTSARYINRFEIKSSVYDAEAVRRKPPLLVAEDPFSAVVLDNYEKIQLGFPYLPASYLVKIKKVLLFKNKLYLAADDGRPLPIYENFRSGEREDLDQDVVEMTSAHRIRARGDTDYIFIGSAGSFNFGHFIVDDFAKFAAIKCEGLRSSVKIVMTSFPGRIDAIRSEAATFFVPSASDVIIMNRTTCYEFDAIYYVTPSSYHPVMKSNAALDFTRRFLLDRSQAAKADAANAPIYIGRQSYETRRLLNETRLLAFLGSYGIEAFDVSAKTLLEQVATFRDARGAIGVMGAAMTSQLFLPKDAYTIHLAPRGWIEPFYWDLAAQVGQHYAAAYGTTSEEEPVLNYQKSFEIDEQAVLALVEAAMATSPTST